MLVIIAPMGQFNSRVRKPSTNGKVERLFRTFKRWWRGALLPWGWPGLSARLEDFRGWFNNHRPHSALGGRTPIEAWCHEVLPEPSPIYARDDETPEIDVRRINYRGDPRLPVVCIHLTKEDRRAA